MAAEVTTRTEEGRVDMREKSAQFDQVESSTSADGTWRTQRGKLHLEYEAPADLASLAAAGGLAELFAQEDGHICTSSDLLLQHAAVGDVPRVVWLEPVNRGIGYLGIMAKQPHMQAAGWAYAQVGWQADLQAGLAMSAPALHRATPQHIDWDASGLLLMSPEHRHLPLSSPRHVPVRANRTAPAHLYVRHSMTARAHEVPREHWAFARYASPTDTTPQESDEYVALLDGRSFSAQHYYTLQFEARETLVPALGLLAVAAAARYLRRMHGYSHVLLFGASQTGRLLQTMLAAGLVASAEVDGVFVAMAGASRGPFLRRGGLVWQAMPMLSPLRAPFDVRSLLAQGFDRGSKQPRFFFVNSSIEYARGDAALLHVSTDGTSDIDAPENARLYLLRGSPHSTLATWPPSHCEGCPPSMRALQQQWTLPVSYDDISRSLLRLLARWVTHDETPPDSRVPRLRDATLVRASDVSAHVLRAHRIAVAFPGLSPLPARDDATEEPLSSGVKQSTDADDARVPPYVGSLLLPSLDDETHNEQPGIASPAVDVALGSFYGWALRHEAAGNAQDLTMVSGSFLPMSPAQIASRYQSRAHYLQLVLAACERSAPFLGAADYDAVIARAADLYDWIHSLPVA